MSVQEQTTPHTPAPAGPPLIQMRGVDKVYSNGTVAVRDVDLDVGAAQFMTLLGPSGCGKSTLLRMIAGLGDITGGTIDWPNSDHATKGRANRDIGFVFQEPTLMPWAAVFDNVYLPFRLKHIPKSKVRDTVMEALELVHLEAFADSYPRELSGGMKMRVSIARALVTKPKVLLMDEPFAALDEITRFKLNNDLLELWQGHDWTIIFVTHSVYESVFLANRVVVMAARPGRVIADLPIDVPYPRDESFRTSPTYNDYCREVSGLLKVAMGGQPEA